ncbi:MAG: DNA mismatch repair endonuclease MutL, partial [Plesiomonas shigelloides]
IALARFDVSFILRHNGKVLRQYRAAANAEQRERRLAAVCGQEFLQHALAVEWEHADLKISGWVCTPQGSRAQNDMAYSYVNGRMMRDKLIHHAIRQAYQTLLQDSEHPAFVLYLELDPHQVDVNVHPAKHEVRFHQARLVHDFIYQAVLTALQHASPAATAASDVADFARDALQDATPRAAAGSSEFTAVSATSDSAPREYTDTPPARAASAEAHPASVRERSAGYGSYTGSYAGAAPVSREQAAAYARLMQLAPVDTSDTTAASPTAATLFSSAPSAVATTGADPRSDSASSAGGHSATAAQRPEPRPEVNDCRAPQGSLGRALSVVNGRFLLLEQSQGLALLCLPRAALWRVQAQLTPEGQPLKAQPLLIPLQLTLSAEHVTCIRSQQALLQQLGLDLHCSERNKVLVRAVPLPLRHHNLQQIIPHLLNKLCADPTIDIALLVAWLAEQLKDEQERWSLSQAVSLVADIEHLCAERVRQEYQTLIKPVQLEAAMAAFDHHD